MSLIAFHRNCHTDFVQVSSALPYTSNTCQVLVSSLYFSNNIFLELVFHQLVLKLWLQQTISFQIQAELAAGDIWSGATMSRGGNYEGQGHHTLQDVLSPFNTYIHQKPSVTRAVCGSKTGTYIISWPRSAPVCKYITTHNLAITMATLPLLHNSGHVNEMH